VVPTSRIGLVALALAISVGCRAQSGSEKAPADAGNAGAHRGGTTSVPEAGRGGASSEDAGGGRGGGDDWLHAPGAWQSVETFAGCSTRVALDPAAIWPGFAFQSCGTGCQESRVLPGRDDGLAALLGTSARVTGGEFLLSLSSRFVAERAVFVFGTYAFGDGKPLALVVEEGDCFAQLASRTSPYLFQLFPLQEELVFKLAWLDTTATTPVLRWLPSPFREQMEEFDFASGWGGVADFKTVFVSESPLSVSLTTVYESQGILRTPVGSDGVAAFSEWIDGQGRIVGYRAEQGAVTLASGSWYPARLGISADRVAWLGATGSRVEEGGYESARLYFCARATPLSPCRIEEGPTLPILSSTGVLVTAGPWIALTGCSEIECDVYLVDTRDSSVRRLRRTPDHGNNVLGISMRDLFVADFSPATRGTQDFDGLLRYDLDDVDAFTTRL
jgi:hypothetical protein